MIAQVTGTLVARAPDRIEVMTAGGVAYECLIPLAVFEGLPAEGAPVTLHTHLAVREDAWQLYGFGSPYERAVFQRLLAAKGVGPALALGILSALTPDRVARALREKDVTTLMRVPRVGRKKAEQIILDLADSLDALGAPPRLVAGGRPRRRPPTTRCARWWRWAMGCRRPTGRCASCWRRTRARAAPATTWARWCGAPSPPSRPGARGQRPAGGGPPRGQARGESPSARLVRYALRAGMTPMSVPAPSTSAR